MPFSLYEVKVGVYNNKGEGPFSPVTTVFSAEEGMETVWFVFSVNLVNALWLQINFFQRVMTEATVRFTVQVININQADLKYEAQ